MSIFLKCVRVLTAVVGLSGFAFADDGDKPNFYSFSVQSKSSVAMKGAKVLVQTYSSTGDGCGPNWGSIKSTKTDNEGRAQIQVKPNKIFCFDAIACVDLGSNDKWCATLVGGKEKGIGHCLKKFSGLAVWPVYYEQEECDEGKNKYKCEYKVVTTAGIRILGSGLVRNIEFICDKSGN